MRNSVLFLLCLLLNCGWVEAASRPHVINFGRWTKVKLLLGPDENSSIDLEVRELLVDAREKAFTTGTPHEVTSRRFVVQQAVRLNDDLPSDKGPVHWIWQRGDWVLVDRSTGRISTIHLPEFQPQYSQGSWYRDYFAYCGISEDGRKHYAMVTELGQRKPVLKEAEREISAESPCTTPIWQRGPVRVTFHTAATNKNGSRDLEITYRIGAYGANAVSGQQDKWGPSEERDSENKRVAQQ